MTTDAEWAELVGPNIKRLIDEFVEFGRLDSYFVKTVLLNDLIGAATSADEESRKRLVHIARYVHNEIPGNCHGSKAAVENWTKIGGSRGEEQLEEAIAAGEVEVDA